MSKKIKMDAPIEFEKDKRGLRDIPDTLRRHARMSKKQITWSLIIAGILLVLLAAVMVITNNLATAPLEAYESANIMKDAAGADYIDITNKSKNIEFRQPNGEDNYTTLNDRHLILLRRSGVLADDYWFTVVKSNHVNKIKNGSDKIVLETEDGNAFVVFKAKQVNIDETKEDWAASIDEAAKAAEETAAAAEAAPDDAEAVAAAEEAAAALTALQYTPEFINYNGLPADYFTEKGSDTVKFDESNEYAVLLDKMMSRYMFIQYTVVGASGQISLFRATDVDLKKADDAISRLQIIRLVFIVLLIAALGVLAYTLKAKKILSKDRARQRLIRLAVLGVSAALTAVVVFLTVLITNQNDALIRINPKYFPYEVDGTEKIMTAGNNFDDFPETFTAEQLGQPEIIINSSESDPDSSDDGNTEVPVVIDIQSIKTYIDQAESEKETDNTGDEQASEASSDTEENTKLVASGLADGIITFSFYTSDEDIIWVPNKEDDSTLNPYPTVLRLKKKVEVNGKKENRVMASVTAYMHATANDAEIPGSNFIWRILYYTALALIVVLFVVLLYYFRYERDLGFPIINTVILIVLMIVTLYPVLNTVAYSFSSGNAASRGKVGLIPQEFTTKSYRDILDNYMLGAAKISVTKTIITTILNLFWTGMLAFTLTRKEYKLGKPITLIMVLTMYVNAGLIPNFLLISQTLGLRNTFWVYIIPTMYSCFNMIIIRTYIASLPGELVESARIDGAGDIRIYWQIIFPLCAPVLATVALFIAVGSWNSWFDTMLYNDSVKSLHTLQYVLKGKIATASMTASLAQTSSAAAAEMAKTTVNSRTVQCATTVVTALPILVVYPFLQKYFVTGMALGSVKG